MCLGMGACVYLNEVREGKKRLTINELIINWDFKLLFFPLLLCISSIFNFKKCAWAGLQYQGTMTCIGILDAKMRKHGNDDAIVAGFPAKMRRPDYSSVFCQMEVYSQYHDGSRENVVVLVKCALFLYCSFPSHANPALSRCKNQRQKKSQLQCSFTNQQDLNL